MTLVWRTDVLGPAICRRGDSKLSQLLGTTPCYRVQLTRPSILRHTRLNKEQEYRRNAAESMRLAERMADPGDRRLLVALAERWLHLADRRSRLLRKKEARVPEHPLVRKRLGPDQTGAE